MKLCYLLKNLQCRIFGNAALEIRGLYHKDTEVKENGLFFCLRGTKVDGENFVKSAIKNGAVAIVCEQEISGISGVCQIIVKNARAAMSQIASRFYKNPSSKLKLIGVTGTNGKTTTTNMLSAILKAAGKKVAIVGTNGVFIKDKRYDTSMTTPDPIILNGYFDFMVKNHIEYVCIEVSAHALELCKLEGLKFEAVIFTNLTEDHLDFFKTMENYFLAKKKLFSKKYASLAIVNLDDDYSNRILEGINIRFVTYSKVKKADFFAEKILTEANGQKIKINNDFGLKLSMLGDFNISNALAALATLLSLGFEKEDLIKGLETMPQVEGRFNSFDLAGVTVIVDFAHTPDGLKNILQAAKKLAGENKLFVVFGCGGNRDRQKRAIMGSLASEFCDYVFISNDNPRFEKPEAIAADIAAGITNENYEICLDRSLAINKAYKKANRGDVIVIAGKGAEDYIEENGNKIFYSDRLEVEKIRRNL